MNAARKEMHQGAGVKPEGKVAIIIVESCDFWSLHNLKKDAAIREPVSAMPLLTPA